MENEGIWKLYTKQSFFSAKDTYYSWLMILIFNAELIILLKGRI